jgi:hypothetical protein
MPLTMTTPLKKTDPDQPPETLPAVVAPADLVIDEPSLEAKFATVKQYHEMVRASFAQGAAFMILCGVELIRLQKEFGETRGGDHRKQKFQTETLAELVEKHTGISKTTAWRYKEMAKAAKKRIPLLDAAELLSTPVGQLPDLRRKQLYSAVKKATDSQTATQLMMDWGICKKPPGNRGAKPTYKRKPGDSTEDITDPFFDWVTFTRLFTAPDDLSMADKESAELLKLVELAEAFAAKGREILKGRKGAKK